MHPFDLPVLLLALSIVFYIQENIQDHPSIVRGAVFLMAIVQSFVAIAM